MGDPCRLRKVSESRVIPPLGDPVQQFPMEIKGGEGGPRTLMVTLYANGLAECGGVVTRAVYASSV